MAILKSLVPCLLCHCLLKSVYGGIRLIQMPSKLPPVEVVLFEENSLSYELQDADHAKVACRYMEGFALNYSKSLALLTECGSSISGFVRLDDEYGYAFHQNDSEGFYVKTIESPRRIQKRNVIDATWDGYFVGKLFEVIDKDEDEVVKNKTKRGEIVCEGVYCKYFKTKQDQMKYVELAVVADTSVVQFHGKDNVHRYILTLFNIVSAIYRDPTLGANLKFVITHLILLDQGMEEDPIIEGDSKKSLANVNTWNERYWKSLPSQDRHDIAIWLTRKEFGGPSGYAPVSGICDPARSSSLIKEEGLSSAFIIAHELGHILGMSHDGDKGAGNDCAYESYDGSVMAPMVGATFSFFHWSKCSANEYHLKSDSWSCLLNFPSSSQDDQQVTFLSDTVIISYSLDDQCRMEFGEGFVFCSSFQLHDPCTHLWCSYWNSSTVCKTKKGPPMDGTECGEGQWCVNGLCEPLNKRRSSKDIIKHNPRAGGWSDWGPWGACSRSCGTGISFRNRLCNAPRPAYGGEDCYGKREEFRICKVDPCPREEDFRAQQCQQLLPLLTHQGPSNPSNLTDWAPYEDDATPCALTCTNRRSGEHYKSQEFVVDGTPCTYDNLSNICVQGKCVRLGCDKIIGSPLEEDSCGICGGDGNSCDTKRHVFLGTLSTDDKKLLTIPNGARNIKIKDNTEERIRDLIVLIGNKNESLFPLQNGDLALVDPKTTRRINLVTGVPVIELGTKFNFTGNTITAKGPLVSRVIIMVKSLASDSDTPSNNSRQFNVTVMYQLPPISESPTDFKWIVQGWSKCDEPCGGGKQQTMLKCVSKVTGKKARKPLCSKSDKMLLKRKVKNRRCNLFSCDYTWAAGQWEDCSHSCGLAGQQIRQIFCVPNDIWTRRESQIWKHMSDPQNCSGKRPRKLRGCNKVPCPGYWKAVRWTSCVSNSRQSCRGSQKLIRKCLPADAEQLRQAEDAFYDFHHCDRAGSIPRRACWDEMCLQRKLETCTDDKLDKSTVCSNKYLLKYCISPSFQQICCHSCVNYTLAVD